MKTVSNNVVSMPWDVEGFIMDRRIGFVAAIHDYHGVNVAFKDGKAFCLIDDIGPLDMNDTKKLIQGSYKFSGKTIVNVYEMDEYSEYVELASMAGDVINENNVHFAKLTPEDVEDIKRRFADLAGYYVEALVGV